MLLTVISYLSLVIPSAFLAAVHCQQEKERQRRVADGGVRERGQEGREGGRRGYVSIQTEETACPMLSQSVCIRRPITRSPVAGCASDKQASHAGKRVKHTPKDIERGSTSYSTSITCLTGLTWFALASPSAGETSLDVGIKCTRGIRERDLPESHSLAHPPLSMELHAAAAASSQRQEAALKKQHT